MSKYVYLYTACTCEARGRHGTPSNEAVDGGELPSVSAWNQTQLFCKQQVFLTTESYMLIF